MVSSTMLQQHRTYSLNWRPHASSGRFWDRGPSERWSCYCELRFLLPLTYHQKNPANRAANTAEPPTTSSTMAGVLVELVEAAVTSDELEDGEVLVGTVEVRAAVVEVPVLVLHPQPDVEEMLNTFKRVIELFVPRGPRYTWLMS